MAVNNSTILAKTWLAGTNDYQQRIPDPTQAGITATIDALMDPMNNQYYNQFMSILVNRIGFTYVRGKSYENPLAVFKDGRLNYGSTIQEIAPKWIKAHSYEDDTETLLKMERPEAAQWFHSQNRRDRYAISVTRDELRSAFTDETGLNQLVAKVMDLPRNADNYDEYRIMLNLIAEYEHRWGFFKQHLSAAPTDEATGKEFLTSLRTYAGKLQFPSTLYNAQDITDIPVFAKPDELVLFVTPETSASVDVNTLAALFNVDRADIPYRTVIVDEFPIPDAVALLTTSDFFVCKDTEYTTTSFFNPETLTNKYYLQHWGVYSVSPFVPAILFTTAEGTAVPTTRQTVNSLTINAPQSIKAGDTAKISCNLEGAIAPTTEGVSVKPAACTYEVTVKAKAAETGKPANVPSKLNSRTYVDNYGVLHTQKTLKATDILTVKATSTYVNPSGDTEAYSATADINVLA